MLDIFLLASTSLPPHLSISPSINEMRSVAMSNVDGVTPNHLLQQMYGTQVVDEEVDLGLSDEDLELVSEGNVDSPDSDVFYRGTRIIVYGDFARAQKQLNDHQQIDYVCNRLPAPPIDQSCCLDPRQEQCHNLRPNGTKPAGDRTIAAEILQQIKDKAPLAIKERRGGLKVDLSTGKVDYNR